MLSVAILADPREDWCPSVHEQALLGCRLRFEFPVCKLLDLARDWQALESNPSPAAVIVMAHVQALKTRGNMELRFKEKMDLTRLLYQRGYGRKDVEELYRLIDWLLALPEDLNLKYKDEVVKMVKDKAMPYITSFERLVRKEGRQEGRQKEGTMLVLTLLRKRLGALSPAMQKAVKGLPLSALRKLGEALLDFNGADDLKSWLRNMKQ